VLAVGTAIVVVVVGVVELALAVGAPTEYTWFGNFQTDSNNQTATGLAEAD
jgi:hypothetical protein